jgi:hypothetical protein
LLRHTLATLAYRAGRAMRDASPEFAAFRASPQSRAPGEIVAHLADLFDWALTLADGKHVWHSSPPLDWQAGMTRFFAALQAFDLRLAAAEPLAAEPEKLFQGPIADALTHVGQISMLRRMAGCPCRGENFFVASIEAGRVGPVQASPIVEF